MFGHKSYSSSGTIDKHIAQLDHNYCPQCGKAYLEEPVTCPSQDGDEILEKLEFEDTEILENAYPEEATEESAKEKCANCGAFDRGTQDYPCTVCRHNYQSMFRPTKERNNY